MRRRALYKKKGSTSNGADLYTYYPFNGDTNDVVRGHNSISEDVNFVAGRNGQAVEFTGAWLNVIEYPQHMFDPSTEGFAMCAWIKSTSTSRGRIFSTGADLQNVMVEFNANGVAGRLLLDAPSKAVVTTDAINISDWFHVFFSTEKTGASFWLVNGVVVGEKEFDDGYQGYVTSKNHLGASRAQNSLRAKGLIDSMGWYNGFLTIEQAQAEYQRHLTGDLV